jgi:uncharacterized membrane protein YfhO
LRLPSANSDNPFAPLRMLAYPANVAFMGTPLPAGRHLVTLEYFPKSLTWWAAVSALSWIALAWWAQLPRVTVLP